jgi:hypothetical protein
MGETNLAANVNGDSILHFHLVPLATRLNHRTEFLRMSECDEGLSFAKCPNSM